MAQTQKKVSISEKLERLEEKINWFYSEDFSLDSATAKYKETAKLAKEIEEDLDKLKNEITVIQKDFSKSVSTDDFDGGTSYDDEDYDDDDDYDAAAADAIGF